MSEKIVYQPFVKENVVKDEDYAISFLQGLFAAEGDVNVNKGRVTELRISSKYLEERKFYEKVCKTARIDAKASLKTHHVVITGLWNILKCLEIDIAKLHEIRKERLIKNLNNMQTIKAFSLLSNGDLTVRQMTKGLGISGYININKNFHNLFVHGFINRKKISKVYTYYVTERGRSLHLALNIPQRN